jgi:hypothetical protein
MTSLELGAAAGDDVVAEAKLGAESSPARLHPEGENGEICNLKMNVESKE